jgi:hypothetical protein
MIALGLGAGQGPKALMHYPDARATARFVKYLFVSVVDRSGTRTAYRPGVGAVRPPDGLCGTCG